MNRSKCIFCVKSGHLLGFIVSTRWIMVDPLKVEAIVQLPLPRKIPQLHSLHGKDNFPRRCVANHVDITKGFMRLLTKWVPFYFDEAAQHSFEAFKHALTFVALLSPSDCGKDLFLYSVAAESTIGMVLVQEDDVLEEHVIYYLNRGLDGSELSYTHVEKLSLAVFHVVQWFCHYILLCKTIIVAIINPFQYVLT
jgi:hypothetical protein